jgi:hypothetical protein
MNAIAWILLAMGILAFLFACFILLVGWFIARELPAYMGYWELAPQYLEHGRPEEPKQ